MSSALRSATLILLKDGSGNESDPLVLLLKRSTKSRTLPGVFVFPGGLEEVGDEKILESTWAKGHSEIIDNHWDQWGIETEQLAQRSLGTALRETLEECGLKVPLLLANHSQLHLVAHWLTPFALKRRYNTYFWAGVIQDETMDLVVDGVEISEARWWRPRMAVSAYESGEIDLAVPTLMILMEMSTVLSRSEHIKSWDLLRHFADSPTQKAIQPIISKTNGLKLYLPSDPLYQDLASHGEIEAIPSRDFWQSDLNHLRQIIVKKESDDQEVKRWQRVCATK